MRGDFSQNGSHRSAPQALLHGPEGVGLGAGADDDQAGRVQAEGGEAGTVGTVRPASTPDDDAAAIREPGQQNSGEADGGGARVGGGHFVEAAAGKTAPRQGGIDRLEVQGEHGRCGIRPQALPAEPPNGIIEAGDQSRIGARRSVGGEHGKSSRNP